MALLGTHRNPQWYLLDADAHGGQVKQQVGGLHHPAVLQDVTSATHKKEKIKYNFIHPEGKVCSLGIDLRSPRPPSLAPRWSLPVEVLLVKQKDGSQNIQVFGSRIHEGPQDAATVGALQGPVEAGGVQWKADSHHYCRIPSILI